MIGEIIQGRYAVLEPCGRDGHAFLYVAFDLKGLGRKRLRIFPDESGQPSREWFMVLESGASPPPVPADAKPATPPPIPGDVGQGRAPAVRRRVGASASRPERSGVKAPVRAAPPLSPRPRRATPAHVTKAEGWSPLRRQVVQIPTVLPLTHNGQPTAAAIEAAWFALGEELEEWPEQGMPDVADHLRQQEELESKARDLSVEDFTRFALEE